MKKVTEWLIGKKRFQRFQRARDINTGVESLPRKRGTGKYQMLFSHEPKGKT